MSMVSKLPIYFFSLHLDCTCKDTNSQFAGQNFWHKARHVYLKTLPDHSE